MENETNQKCVYIFTKGKQNGVVCNKPTKEGSEFCCKHVPKKKPNNKTNKEKEEQDDNVTILSTLSLQDIPQINIEEKVTRNVDDNEYEMEFKIPNNDDIDTQYYIDNCIRRFFKQYKSDREIFGDMCSSEKKSNDKNDMSTYLMMGAVGLLPLLFKNFNLSPNINNNALSQQIRPTETYTPGSSTFATNREETRINEQNQRTISETEGHFEKVI